MPFAILLVMIALPMEQQIDRLVSNSGVALLAFAKINPTPPQQRVNVDVLSGAKLRNHTPNIDPAFLRIDFKQNLLVWPNVAGDLTRSPPAPAPV